MKVLVIDDSALMRKKLRQILQDHGHEVEVARHGEEGLEKIESFDPCVVTLDINMPVMDGITCLSLIMQKYPRPVIMVSSLTEKGALATFEALELGAVDYVAKPGGTVSLNIRDVEEDLIEKVEQAAKAKVGKSRGLRQRLRVQRERVEVSSPKIRPRPNRARKLFSAQYKLILIGVSTGGPGTVEEILSDLPIDFPIPILIAQHMPARFTSVFAERLNKCVALNVMELSKPTLLESGKVYIARGDADVKLIKRAGKLMATSIPASSQHLWHPSVERMVRSASEHLAPENLLLVQLTGMGNDGSEAMAELHKQGATSIAESEETAVVYGMPRELVKLDGAEKILPSNEIGQQLIQWTM